LFTIEMKPPRRSQSRQIHPVVDSMTFWRGCAVPESIEIDLKRAVIILADELSYLRAAKRLKIAPAKLREQISALEKKLSLYIFEQKRGQLELTKEGNTLVNAFRKSVALHDRQKR
jgi:hypothetical protein